MSHQQLSTRAGCKSLEATDPYDADKTITVFMRWKKAEYWARRGKHAVAEITELVPWGLLHPCHAYLGVRRDEEEEGFAAPEAWLIYAVTPQFAFDRVNSGTKTCPRDGEVYLISVNEDRIVYHWRWDKCEPWDSTRPIGYLDRYKEELW